VVHAEARGSGYEAHLLAPLLESTRSTFAILDPGQDVFAKVMVTADSGFHSRAVLAAVERTGANAYMPIVTIVGAIRLWPMQVVTRSGTGKSAHSSAGGKESYCAEAEALQRRGLLL
jgi:hypothetical protein